MSPPIRDGSGDSIGSIRLGDGSEISEVRTGGGDVVFSAVPPSGILHYDYESGSGSIEDNFGSFTGTLAGGASFTSQSASGQFAVNVPGSAGDGIDVADFYGGLSAFSFATRVNIDSYDNQRRILGSSNNAVILRQNDNGSPSDGYEVIINSSSNGGKAGTGGTVNTGTYDHLAVVYDSSGLEGGDTVKLYQNSSVVLSANVSGSNLDSGGTVGIMQDGSSDRPSNGKIDDTKAYDKALSSSEVSSLDNQGSI